MKILMSFVLPFKNICRAKDYILFTNGLFGKRNKRKQEPDKNRFNINWHKSLETVAFFQVETRDEIWKGRGAHGAQLAQ